MSNSSSLSQKEAFSYFWQHVLAKLNEAAYELPIASKLVLGGVKVGENLSITEDGTLSAQGAAFETDETLSLTDGVLSVNCAQSVEQGNTLPITSAAVYTILGDIETALAAI